MVVEVERSYVVDAPIDDVWVLLADPANRAKAISVVTDFETDGDITIWHLSLPIPFIDRTITVRTRDIERNPPNYVKFIGDSAVMSVTGEHELTETTEGTRVRNRFVVDGRVPGVERFFEHNIDRELDRIKQAVREALGSADTE